MPIQALLKPALTYLLQQGSILLLKGAEKAIGYLKGIDEEPSQPLTHKDVNHIQAQIRSATSGNTCVRCGARGAVVSKYLPKPVYSAPRQGHALAKAIVERGYSPVATLPITWKCIQCNEYVCFNCTMVIPDSVPLQFYEDTFCSETCRDNHMRCVFCEKPRVCYLNKIDGVTDERLDEHWRCETPGCEGNTGIKEAKNGN